jgi:hypothetical protein
MIDKSAAERRYIIDRDDNVSPLRGFIISISPDPMAYAMGNRSFAAPRLDMMLLTRTPNGD